ncbi:unnamed protein product [Linum trigynum]|uniref:Uncharacterized protein n=1 Tax=Linum trigynum TaxID=586398 RepID=A0AAV2FVD9_9ROSI
MVVLLSCRAIGNGGRLECDRTTWIRYNRAVRREREARRMMPRPLKETILPLDSEEMQATGGERMSMWSRRICELG